jgi:hypothetical protein
MKLVRVNLVNPGSSPKREAIRYRPSSGEQAWRKRADLRTRLNGLRSEQAALPPCLGRDPRQIENIIAMKNKIQGAQPRNLPLPQSWARRFRRGNKHFAANEATSRADMELTT